MTNTSENGVRSRENLREKIERMLIVTSKSIRKNKKTEDGVWEEVFCWKSLRRCQTSCFRCEALEVIPTTTQLLHSVYKLGTTELAQLFVRNLFSFCAERMLEAEGVTDSVKSQQEWDGKLSLTGGQGYQQRICTCKYI
jgi:CRISPR/Cas system-associated endoribonuclease Cas2